MTDSCDATSHIYMLKGLEWSLEVEHLNPVCIVESIKDLSVASHQLVIAVPLN